jgi:hypothetical protein
MPLVLAAVLSLLVASPPQPLPRVGLSARDGRGCGAPVLDGLALRGGAPGLCVRDAFAVRLEDAPAANVVLRVAKDGRDRIFVYRLDGHRLVPRFLGSGPDDLRLVEVLRRPGTPLDRLEVVARRGGGQKLHLLCRFEEFPLVCDEVSP